MYISRDDRDSMGDHADDDQVSLYLRIEIR